METALQYRPVNFLMRMRFVASTTSTASAQPRNARAVLEARTDISVRIDDNAGNCQTGTSPARRRSSPGKLERVTRRSRMGVMARRHRPGGVPGVKPTNTAGTPPRHSSIRKRASRASALYSARNHWRASWSPLIARSSDSLVIWPTSKANGPSSTMSHRGCRAPAADDSRSK